MSLAFPSLPASARSDRDFQSLVGSHGPVGVSIVFLRWVACSFFFRSTLVVNFKKTQESTSSCFRVDLTFKTTSEHVTE